MILYSILIFVASVISVSYFIKKIIYISNEKHLFDEPGNNRKVHVTRTPNLGGVAIFISMVFTGCIYFSFVNIPHINYIFLASLTIIIIGLTDDLVGMNPFKKMLAQLAIALLLAFFTDLRIDNLYGFLGIHEIPFAASIILSSFVFIYFINAFNLIDGINCLAGSIGLLASSGFVIYFSLMNDVAFTFISVAMCGCLAGFLFYNRTPAKIFMGDTGSLFLGLTMAMLSIHFLQINEMNIDKPGHIFFHSAPGLLAGLFIVPLYDTLRVFTLRIVKGNSPFLADRNHIHHWLINLGVTHLKATVILVTVTITALLLAVMLQEAGIAIVLASLDLLALFLNLVLYKAQPKKVKPIMPIKNSFSRPGLKIMRKEMKVSEI